MKLFFLTIEEGTSFGQNKGYFKVTHVVFLFFFVGNCLCKHFKELPKT